MRYASLMRAVLAPIVVAGACLVSQAQTTGAPTAFEVASIRPAPPPEPNRGMRIRNSGGPGTKDPERYTAENFTLDSLIMNAYDLKPYRLSGPDWLENDRYNVTAKVPPGTTKEQFRAMLQNLLAERFGLKVHHETREMSVYELQVAKGGSKLQESEPEKPPGPDQPPPARAGPFRFGRDAEGFPVLPPGDQPMMIMVAGGKAVKRGWRDTPEQIAEWLSWYAGRAVLDATGLKGKYNYTIRWADSRGSMRPDADADIGPSLFAAVQQQLGLRLEAAKARVDVLVVDHAEKTPTEN